VKELEKELDNILFAYNGMEIMIRKIKIYKTEE